MRHSNSDWFEFVSLMEAFYVVNLTAENVLHHGGDLLHVIGTKIKGSRALLTAFAKCTPDSFTKKERIRILRRYFLVDLPSYHKMKARDVIRKVCNGKKRKCVSRSVPSPTHPTRFN